MMNLTIALAIYITPATIAVCIVAGLAIAVGIMFWVRSKLKSVRTAHGACSYVRSGSFRLTNQQDAFLFRNITKVPIPKQNNSGRRS